MKSIISLIMGVCFFISTSETGLSEIWPYDRLQDESDFIAIVQLTKIANVAGDLPENESSDLYQKRIANLKPYTILKGNSVEGEIALHYFTFHDGATTIDPPSFIDFSGSDEFIYLVFLKKNISGWYTPVTGYLDSAFSVKKIIFEYPDTVIDDWKALSNHLVEPTLKTPVESGDEQGSAAHP